MREGVNVESVTAEAGGFVLQTSQGCLEARNVVLATGGAFQVPFTPELAADLPESLHQIHSMAYRNAAQLPAGGVLVVGSGQSGTQIAEDLMLEGRQVHLALGKAPRYSRFYRGKDMLDWLDELGRDGRISGISLGRDKLTSPYVTGRDGGRDIDLYDFADRGMQLYGRIAKISAAAVYFEPTVNFSLENADAFNRGFKGMVDAYVADRNIDAPREAPSVARAPLAEPELLDFAAAGVTSVIWATGLKQDCSWVDSAALDEAGQIRHLDGATEIPGLYYFRTSGLLGSGANWFDPTPIDAGRIAEQIAANSTLTARQDCG
ncbi:NAD(P)-binding domain-containing protein [Renibacterium salmoninarum]|uniref:NAD(P)-binding domain-containing protein n=1 Tax=Renibacterium salmoninarum TaxID=1646 RepID=UPI0009B59FD6|nr:NAD(P)-binding domain-containing protein [Renibacterium salmoninarum]